MSTNAKKVATGKPMIGGAVFWAPAGTTLPTDAKTALDSAYVDLGYISEDGVTNSVERETEEIKAWGGDVVLKPQTSKTDSFTMTFIESLRMDVLKVTHGSDNVTRTGDDEHGYITTVRENSQELDHGIFIVDVVMGEAIKRIVIPDGQITEIGEVTYQDNSAVAYESTITAFPYDGYESDTHREFIETAE